MSENTSQKPKRYTLKKDGRYWTGQGSKRGFIAMGIAGCYSFTLDEAKQLQKQVGGDIVESVHLGGFKYEEGDVVEIEMPKLSPEEKLALARNFIRSIASDGRDTIWQPDWFELKDKAKALLEHITPS